jgi:hypothetical protein
MRASWIVPGLALLALTGCIAASPGDVSLKQTDTDRAPDNATGEIEFASLDEAKLRPGASLGGYCTFNFVFTAPNGSAYVGTAAHCTDGPGERVELGDGTPVGTVAFDSDDASVTDRLDFALVELDADMLAATNPTVQGFEGPTGVSDPVEVSRGDGVGFHGHGVVLGETEATRDREGVLVEATSTEYRADMPAVNGDSGSPVLHESGDALGIVSRYGAADAPPTTDVGPTVAWIVDLLGEAGWQVSLAEGTITGT